MTETPVTFRAKRQKVKQFTRKQLNVTRRAAEKAKKAELRAEKLREKSIKDDPQVEAALKGVQDW